MTPVWCRRPTLGTHATRSFQLDNERRELQICGVCTSIRHADRNPLFHNGLCRFAAFLNSLNRHAFQDFPENGTIPGDNVPWLQ
jgi:hypothetical protein